MTKQKENFTDSTPMELSPMLVAGVGEAVCDKIIFLDIDTHSNLYK